MKPSSKTAKSLARSDHFCFHSPFESVDLLFSRDLIPTQSIFRKKKRLIRYYSPLRKVRPPRKKSRNFRWERQSLWAMMQRCNLVHAHRSYTIPRLFSPLETRLKLCQSQSSNDISQNNYLFTVRKATEMTVNGVRISGLKLLSTCRLNNWSLDREDTKYNSLPHQVLNRSREPDKRVGLW